MQAIFGWQSHLPAGGAVIPVSMLLFLVVLVALLLPAALRSRGSRGAAQSVPRAGHAAIALTQAKHQRQSVGVEDARLMVEP